MPSLLDMDAFMQGQSAQPSQVNTLGKPSNFGDIHGMIDEISLTEGVDPELVRALVKLESGFNPSAKNPGSSASGLMQLVKGTAAEMGVQDVFDHRQNLTGGIRYLKKHLDSTGGDVEKALAMYNQGPAGDLGKARDYVETVKRFYGKNFTQAPTSGASPSLDMSSLMDQYGVDPYPKQEPFSLALPNIPQEQPDAVDVAAGIEESALGRGFSQALNSPQPEVGKLPFGVENKGGKVSQWAKDVLYGLPEGLMTLGAGLVGLPAAAIGGTAKAMTSGLEAGGDTFNEIAATAMGHPQTATAQYMMKPFEVIFGGILNSGAEVVKDLNPDATPEELDSKIKATQFVMNLAMVAPMFKGVVKGRGKVDADNPAKSLDAHEVTPEVVEGAKAQVMADPAVSPEVRAQVGGVDVGVLQSIQKKAATSVAKERVQKAGVPEAKFPENQSIVEGLLTEVELREGRAKTTMRKAATIVAQHEGDIALADLSALKGINVKGSTGKAIARLVEERDALRRSEEIRAKWTGEDVPLWEETPIEPVKSLDDIPPKVEAEVPKVEEPVVEAPTQVVDPIPEMVASIDPSLKYDGKMAGIPEAGIPDIHNLTLTLEDGRQPSFSISGEVTPEKINAEVQKVKDKFQPKIEGVIEDGQVRTEGREAPQEVVIPEFDDVKVARDEGYSFVVNKRFGKLEDAQAKVGELGEGHEVVKVGEKYRVAKFEETSPIAEFADEGAVNRAGLELMSEIPADKVQFESPTVEEGFGLAKVGDKYYRTSPMVEMPERGAKVGKSQREPIVDGVSASDWEALKAFTDEATLKELRAKDTLKELANTAKLEEVKSPETNAALAQAFVEWRDSYVTKCNVAQKGKKGKTPITKESLAPIDDNFKTFKNMEDAQEWMESTGAVGELIPDPLTGKVSFMNTEKLKGLEEMDLWDEGVEQLTGRRESRLEDWDNPEMEMRETGVRDLFSIFNNERGSVDVTSLYSAVDAVNKVVADAKKMSKSIDDYLSHIGADEVAIAAFKAAMAQAPQLREQLKRDDPTTSAILMPEGKVVAQTVIRNKNKEVKSVGPPITEELATKAMGADRSMQWGTDLMRVDPETGKVRVEHTTNAFEKAMQATEVKINSFRAAGLSEIYSQWREAKSAAEREKGQIKEWLDGLESQIAPERREAFALAAYGDMKSVKEALGTMGITEIPQLTPKESMVLEQLFDYTRKFRDRANYIRTHTGQKAIPQLKDMSGRENYLPLMRDLNVLRDMGLTEGLTISDSKKLGELSKKFNGMFNPNAKKRNVSDIPIELDPFKALRRHADYGIAEIHISPVAALAKDLANLKLPRPDGVKGKISLVDWNPNLSRMLSRWSDQIVGKDVVATAMANANPFFAWFKDRLSKNLVVATIGGSLRTVLVQPTSYIIGIPTMLDMRSAGYGIAKLMSERPFGKSNARQNSSVLAIREADYAFKELSDYIQQGKMSGTVGYLAEKSLAPMKWVDSVMAEAGWNAARYYGEKRLKLQGKELYRFADDIVERTQGLGIKGAVSDVQSSAATKWLTLLQTFAIADFNLIARDVLGIKNPEASQGKTIMRVAKYTAATILAGQMYKMMGLDNVVPDPIGAYEDAKKEGKGDLRAVGAAAGELLEKVPLIGGSAKYSSSLFGIAGEWGSILPEAGEKFAASLDWKKLTPKQRAYNTKLIARAVGMTAGVPMTNQILKSINAYSKGGNPYQVILGVYEVEKKKKGGLRPSVPRPPLPPKPF